MGISAGERKSLKIIDRYIKNAIMKTQKKKLFFQQKFGSIPLAAHLQDKI